MSQRQIKWIHNDELKQKRELKKCEKRIEEYKSIINDLNNELQRHKRMVMNRVYCSDKYLNKLLEGSETEPSIYYETLEYFGLHPRDINEKFIDIMIKKFHEMCEHKYNEKYTKSEHSDDNLKQIIQIFNKINRYGGGKIEPNKITWNQDRINQIIMNVGRLNLYGSMR